MSSTQSVRVRSQRTAAAAVQRARLSLIKNRPSSAPRAPFAVLVFAILGLGVVGLLMFNTHMQQASFYATTLQAKADRLEARSEALSLQLERKRDPQRLGEASRKLGMVTPPNPAVINLQDGSIEGKPLAATPADGTKTFGDKPPLPRPLDRKPIYKFVLLGAANGQTTTANGSASHANAPAAGSNNAQKSSTKNSAAAVQGAHR